MRMKELIRRFAPGLFLLIPLLFLAIPATRADDAAGVYKAKCATCHAADGSGNTPVGKALKIADLRSDEVQKKTDAQLIEVTTNGKDKMPAFKGKLSDDQIKQ